MESPRKSWEGLRLQWRPRSAEGLTQAFRLPRTDRTCVSASSFRRLKDGEFRFQSDRRFHKVLEEVKDSLEDLPSDSKAWEPFSEAESFLILWEQVFYQVPISEV